VTVNNSIITTKQKKVYNSDGQQFHHYNKTKESLHITVVNFVLFCCIGRIVDHHGCKLSFVFVVMMELLTITVINFLLFCCNDGIAKQKKVYNSDGQQFHHYNKTKESLQQ
jgi:hypothetical protein